MRVNGFHRIVGRPSRKLTVAGRSSDDPAMRITNFILADYAQVHAGKVYLCGACIDRVGAKKYPANLRCFIFVRCESEINDTPAERGATLRLMDSDGAVVLAKPVIETTETTPNDQIVAPVDLVFTHAGPYRLEFSVAGVEQSASWPLVVLDAPPS